MAGDISGTVELVMLGGEEYQVYDVPVDYDLSHTQQIEAAKFKWIKGYNSNLILNDPTEHLYPLPTGKITQRIILVCLGYPAKERTVLARMEEFNVRPVLSPEFLALTMAFSDLQQQFPLVGLGTVWASFRGYHNVLFAEDYEERRLNLLWSGNEWISRCRFPAVCM